jgi:hypothetical protein
MQVDKERDYDIISISGKDIVSRYWRGMLKNLESCRGADCDRAVERTFPLIRTGILKKRIARHMVCATSGNADSHTGLL